MTWEKRLLGAAAAVALVVIAGSAGELILQALSAVGLSPPEVANPESGPRIAPTTALSLALAGGALFVHTRQTMRLRRTATALCVASMVMVLLGLLGGKIGVRAPAYDVIAAVVLQGVSLLLLDRIPRAAQTLTLLSALLALLAFSGYVYGSPVLYRSAERDWGMALVTAIALICLSVGILCARPLVGFMALVTLDNTAGRTMRRLLPLLLSVPLLSFVLDRLAKSRSYTFATIAAVLAVFGIFAAAGILFTVGSMLVKQERLQARLNDIISNCSDTIVDTSPGGIVLGWNRAAEHMYGFTAAEMIGHSILGIVPARDKMQVITMRMQILKNGQSQVYEGWQLQKGGVPFFAATTLSPVRDAAGRIVGISAITRDVTMNYAARTVEDATQKISAVLADLPSGDVPSVLRVVTECARTLTGSQSAAAGLGEAPEEAFEIWVDENGGAPPRPAHLAEDRPDWAGAEATPLSFQGRQLGMLYVLKKEPFSEIDKLVLRLLTERAAAAVEIAIAYTKEASERAKLHSVIDQMPDPVLLLDERGRVKQLNRAALAIAGQDPASCNGCADGVWLDLRRSGGKRIAFDERPLVRALQRSEETHGIELVVHTANGCDVPYVVNAAPVHYRGTIIGAVEVLQDISTWKELERLREEWTALVAHDLRQPVTMIRLSADALERTFAENSPSRTSLARIRRALAQLDRMIQDLLDYAQIEADRLKIHREEVELRKLVTDVVRDIAEVTAPHAVHLRIEDEPLPVEVDPGRITQVLSNLLTNAAKYSTPGSEIVVAVKRVGGESHVMVQNHGRGIEAKDLPVLFERFWRSKATRESGVPGLGLGLPITRGIVEAHGGRIWAESIPDGVTTFHIALPLLAEVDRAA